MDGGNIILGADTITAGNQSYTGSLIQLQGHKVSQNGSIDFNGPVIVSIRIGDDIQERATGSIFGCPTVDGQSSGEGLTLGAGAGIITLGVER